jgi:hypothetical protein
MLAFRVVVSHVLTHEARQRREAAEPSMTMSPFSREVT